MKFQIDQFSWENLQTENSNSINDLLTEFQNQPPPVIIPDEMIQAATAPETPSTAPGTPEHPKTPVFGPQSAPAPETAHITSRMILKGWNALFAAVGIYFSGKPEKYEFYKASERDLNELADLFTEMQAAYGWNIAPWLPFAIGFTGIYGAKAFEVFQDRQTSQPGKDYDTRMSEIEKEIQLAEKIAELNTKKVPVEKSVSNRGTKPGTKRGPYKKNKA